MLDVGCGTGLNFAYLQRKVQASGTVIGLDRSPQMLDRARRRSRRNGWKNVILLEADAAGPRPESLAEKVEAAGGARRSQAVFATYALSLMADWYMAWENMIALTDPGGRAAIVDMQKPYGKAAIWSSLAVFACRLGGSDIDAHPWTALEEACHDTASSEAWGGHLQIRSGTLPH